MANPASDFVDTATEVVCNEIDNFIDSALELFG